MHHRLNVYCGTVSSDTTDETNSKSHTSGGGDDMNDVLVLSLEQGENWLCWDYNVNENIKDDDDDEIDHIQNHNTRGIRLCQTQPPLPVVEETTGNSTGRWVFCCFICLDVDGSVATIKDMRVIVSNDNSNNHRDELPSMNRRLWTLRLRQESHHQHDSSSTPQGSGRNRSSTHSTIVLPRRRMHVLRTNDQIDVYQRKDLDDDASRLDGTNMTYTPCITLHYRGEAMRNDPNATTTKDYASVCDSSVMSVEPPQMADDTVATTLSAVSVPSPTKEQLTADSVEAIDDASDDDNACDSDTASESDFANTQTTPTLSSAVLAVATSCDGLLTQPSQTNDNRHHNTMISVVTVAVDRNGMESKVDDCRRVGESVAAEEKKQGDDAATVEPMPSICETVAAGQNKNNDTILAEPIPTNDETNIAEGETNDDDAITVEPMQDATQAYEWRTQAEEGYCPSPFQKAMVGDSNSGIRPLAHIDTKTDLHFDSPQPNRPIPTATTAMDKILLHPSTESVAASPLLLDNSPPGRRNDVETQNDIFTTDPQTQPISTPSRTEDPQRAATTDASMQCSTYSLPPHVTVPTNAVASPSFEIALPDAMLTSSHSEDQTIARRQSFQTDDDMRPDFDAEPNTTTFDADDPDREGDSRDAEHREEVDPSVGEHDVVVSKVHTDKRDEAHKSDQRTVSSSLEAPKDDMQSASVSSDHVSIHNVDKSEGDQNCSRQGKQTIQTNPVFEKASDSKLHETNPAFEKASDSKLHVCVEGGDTLSTHAEEDDDATQDPMSTDQNIPLVDLNDRCEVKPVVEKPNEKTQTKVPSTLTCVADSIQPLSATTPLRKQRSDDESVLDLASVVTAKHQTGNDDDAEQDTGATTATTDRDVPCPASEDMIESLPTLKGNPMVESAMEMIVQMSPSLTEGVKSSRKRKEVPTVESVPQSTRELTPSSSLERRPSRKRKGSTELVPAAADCVANSSLQTPTAASLVKRKTRSTATKRLTTSVALGQSSPDGAVSDQPIRILTTGVDLDKKQEKMIASLGGTLLRDTAQAHTATHVIASDGTTEVRRTVKLMIALCRCWTNNTHIVTLDWLIQSARQRRPLPGADFRIVDPSPPRPATDTVQPFRMTRTWQNIQRNQRDGMHLLLDQWSVYVCPGVAGKKAPSSSDFQLVVEAAGAVWWTSRTDPNATSLLDHHHHHRCRVLVITGDPETKAQVKGGVAAALLQAGASKRTTTWFFDAMMRQNVDLPLTCFSDGKQRIL